MTPRIVLAFSGSDAACAAVAWLAETHGAEVVALTLDLGQIGDLEAQRARALACGAARAHALDVRDAFARDALLPALSAAAGPPLAALATSIIARSLVETAALEGAEAVAHASAGRALDEAVAALAPSLRVLAPARDWTFDAAALSAYLRGRGLPHGGPGGAHLLFRPAVDPQRAPDSETQLELLVEAGVPAALNGVAMPPAELIEIVSLLAGQAGIGHGAPAPAPAAAVLRAALAAATGARAVVRLALRRGTVTVRSTGAPDAPRPGAPVSELVNQS